MRINTKREQFFGESNEVRVWQETDLDHRWRNPKLSGDVFAGRLRLEYLETAVALLTQAQAVFNEWFSEVGQHPHFDDEVTP